MRNRVVNNTLVAVTVFLGIATVNAQAEITGELIAKYQTQGAGTPQVSKAASMWTQTFTSSKAPKERSCSTCHTKNLTQQGKHAKTGKPIEPMAPSVNSKRLTDGKKIEKWLKRNCKWTLGRECSAQEKTDFIAFIRGL